MLNDWTKDTYYKTGDKCLFFGSVFEALEPNIGIMPEFEDYGNSYHEYSDNDINEYMANLLNVTIQKEVWVQVSYQ